MTNLIGIDPHYAQPTGGIEVFRVILSADDLEAIFHDEPP